MYAITNTELQRWTSMKRVCCWWTVRLAVENSTLLQFTVVQHEICKREMKFIFNQLWTKSIIQLSMHRMYSTVVLGSDNRILIPFYLWSKFTISTKQLVRPSFCCLFLIKASLGLVVSVSTCKLNVAYWLQ